MKMQLIFYKKIPIVDCATENKYTIISVEVQIMKFCDKLANLRKKNNITQEILADKVNVSRQAVSKWENGTSMPDMKTIMELCQILNCNLEDLIDDRAIVGKGKKDERFKVNNYLKELLDFITKTYNMFWSMKFKEKFKCLFEICFLILILYFGWMVLGWIISSFVDPILWNLPASVSTFVKNILEAIYVFISIISSFIIVIHLFKIRYLDYFVTVEDATVQKKSVEDAIDENKQRVIIENDKKVVVEKQKEKIIIRDPKHSSYSFLHALGNLVIMFCKAVAFVIGILALISFVMITFFFFVSIFYIFEDLIFLGIMIVILSLVILNFLVIYLLYAFIFEQKLKKHLFFGFIATVVLMAFGTALAFIQMLDFKYIDKIEDTTNIITKTSYLNVDEKTQLSLIYYHNAKIVIDNNLENVEIKVTSLKNNPATLSSFIDYNGNNYFYLDHNSDNPFSVFSSIIKMINDHEWYSSFSMTNIEISISEKDLQLLKNNRY